MGVVAAAVAAVVRSFLPSPAFPCFLPVLLIGPWEERKVFFLLFFPIEGLEEGGDVLVGSSWYGSLLANG